jgi:hypothetical protein
MARRGRKWRLAASSERLFAWIPLHGVNWFSIVWARIGHRYRPENRLRDVLVPAYDPRIDEPDLDAPGKPLIAQLKRDGGTLVPFEIEQTKRNNYQELCTVMGGADKVTRNAVEAAGLDWREWGYFVVEMLEDQRDTQEHITSEVARIESATGEKIELPETVRDRLGLLHLKNPPEQTPPTGEREPPTGREPPPNTSWG